MSDPSHQRLIRAVRLLPGVVRVGRGTMEDIPEKIEAAAAGTEGPAKVSESEKKDSALVAAQAEVRKLKSELRGRESELTEARSAIQSLKAQNEADRAALEREKAGFYEAAKAEAARAKEDAAKAGHEEGAARGYGDGLKKAEAEVSADYQNRFSEALTMLANIGASLSGAREELAAAHAPQLIRLWEMMLGKMLQAEVELNPSIVERSISYILSRVSDRERILIYLNPSDVELVEGAKEGMKDSIRGVKVFELLSDEHVDKGSCLVETGLGIYDARWRTQLEQISSEVHGLLIEVMSSDGTGGE